MTYPEDPARSDTYQSLASIQFVQVPREESSSSDIEISISSNSDEQPEMVDKKLREEVTRRSWWLKDYWREKGPPNEQFTFATSGLQLQVYNFSDRLTPEEIEDFQKMVKVFSGLSVGLGYTTFLIDNNQSANVHSGQDLNGEGDPSSKTVRIEPHARVREPHRIVEVGNFLGTLVHEGAHSLVDTPDENEWMKLFDWQFDFENPIVHTSGYRQVHVQRNPDRSVSEYAKYNMAEDIAESVVAGIFAPERLDPEKLFHLESKLHLSDARSATEGVSFIRREGSEIILPRIDQPVRYFKRTIPKIVVLPR